MLKRLLFLSLLYISISASAQDWQWVREAGGNDFKESKSIAIDISGNSYVTGNFANSISFGATTLTGSPDGSMFIAKYDSNGNIIWTKAIAGSSVVESTDIATDANSNTYITGNFKGTVTLGSFTLASPEDRSAFVAKLDENGNVVWAKDAGSSDGDVKGTNITVDSSGNSYVTGNFFKTAKLGATTITAIKDEQLFIAKYGSNGDVIWVKMAGGLGSCFTHDIATDKNGNLYLAGQFWMTAAFGAITLTNNSDVTKPANVFIAKYDVNGNALWAQQAGGTGGDDVATGITVDTDGNSYITGFFQKDATFSQMTISGNAAGNIFLAKYNTAGNFQWVKKQESTVNARGISIDRDNNGDIYIAGYFEGSVKFGQTTLVSYGETDMFFAKYDLYGNVTGAIRAGGEGIDYTKKLCVSPSGGIYFTGDYSHLATFGSTVLSKGIVVGKLNSVSFDPEPAPTITTGALSVSTLCKGTTIEVPFSTTGRFGQDNVFTVQISNINGSFAYPIDLGSGTTSPISVTIPNYIQEGTGYKIRVVASSPAIPGTSNSTNLTVSKPPVTTATVSSRFIVAGESTKLYASGADSYVWSPATGLSNALIANPIATPQTTTTYTVTGTKNGCSSTATIIVKVEPLPPPGSAFEWSSVKHGGGTDNSEAIATATDDDGNVYVAGHFWDKITFGSTTLAQPEYVVYNHIFIVKYNVNGDVLWAKQVGGEGNNGVKNIAVDKQGNVYLAGWFATSITIGADTFNEDSGFNYYVAKFDGSGNPVWANQIKGPNNEVTAIAASATGEVYLTGIFRDNIAFDHVSLVSSPQKDYFIVKYDVNGNVVWGKNISGTSIKGYRSNDIDTDSEGNLYVTGSFEEGTLIFDTVVLTSTIAYTNSFIAKYTPEGHVQWAKFIGQNISDYSHTTSSFIAVDNYDRIYISGESNGYTKYDDISFASAGVSGNFLARFDTDGRMIWVAEAGGASIRGLTIDAAGFIYTTGFFSNATTFGTKRFTIESTEYAVFVAKYDTFGNAVWAEMAKTKRFFDIMSNGISTDNMGNIYIAGTFDKLGYHDPVAFGCHTIQNDVSGAGHYYVAKLSPLSGEVPTIITGDVENNALCAGSTIVVPFTTSGTGAACTSSYYTVLLSDTKGSFNNAKIIGVGSGSGNKVTATIPANIVAGNGYRVKVIGTAPSVTGFNSPTDINITALPVVSISASIVSPCPGTTGITYTAFSTDQTTSYSWSVPEGWTITEGQGTNRIKVTAGSSAGDVKVTVRGACGADVTKAVSATPANIFAPTVRSTTHTICTASNAVFTASGAPYGATYRWYASATDTEPIWEDSYSGSESRFYTPVVSFTTNFYVAIRFSNGCEGERVKLTLKVNSKPEKPDAIVSSVAKPCVGNEVTYEVPPVNGAYGYEWTAPSGWAIISGQGTSKVSVRVGGATGQVSVVAYNECGPSPAQSVTVEVPTSLPPSAIAGTVCGSGSATVYAMGAPDGASYNWYTSVSGSAAIATGSSFTTPVLTTSTTYYVSIVTATGCESPRTAVPVTVSSSIVVNAGVNEILCTDMQLHVLSGYSPANGIWSGNNVTDNGIFNLSAAGVGEHTLMYTYTDENGCSASATKTIIVSNCTGVTESKLASKMLVYPNPAISNVNIELALPTSTDIKLLLYDAKGQKLYEQNYPKVHGEFKQMLNVKDRPKGLYLLQLILGDGVITRRVVVE